MDLDRCDQTIDFRQINIQLRSSIIFSRERLVPLQNRRRICRFYLSKRCSTPLLLFFTFMCLVNRQRAKSIRICSIERRLMIFLCRFIFVFHFLIDTLDSFL